MVWRWVLSRRAARGSTLAIFALDKAVKTPKTSCVKTVTSLPHLKSRFGAIFPPSKPVKSSSKQRKTKNLWKNHSNRDDCRYTLQIYRAGASPAPTLILRHRSFVVPESRLIYLPVHALEDVQVAALLQKAVAPTSRFR